MLRAIGGQCFAIRSQFAGNRFQFRLVEVGDEGATSFFDNTPGNFFADGACCTGYSRGLI
jgi:hypothetical protein